MEINWKCIKRYKAQDYASCLVTTTPDTIGVGDLTVAFKDRSGKWQLGNGEVCWFDPLYFAYLNTGHELMVVEPQLKDHSNGITELEKEEYHAHNS